MYVRKRGRGFGQANLQVSAPPSATPNPLTPLATLPSALLSSLSPSLASWISSGQGFAGLEINVAVWGLLGLFLLSKVVD